MAHIGNLSFGIGGDDRELRKILEDRKKDALELESILSKIKLGSKNGNGSKEFAESVKLQEQQNRLIISNVKAESAKTKAIADNLINEHRVNDAIQTGIKKRRKPFVHRKKCYVWKNRYRPLKRKVLLKMKKRRAFEETNW